jgi:hypothetical protein
MNIPPRSLRSLPYGGLIGRCEAARRDTIVVRRMAVRFSVPTL